MKTVSLVTIMLMFFVSVSPGAQTCGHSFRKVRDRVAGVADGAAKTTFFPLLLITHAARQTLASFHSDARSHLLRQSADFAKDSWRQALGFLFLSVVGQLATVTDETIEDATRDFEVPREDDVIVVAITPGEGSSDRKALTAMALRKYGTSKKVNLIYPNSYDDLVRSFERIARERGKITKLDIHGHGAPGYFVAGSGLMRDSQHPGLFARDAKVRVFACSTGAGQKGIDYLKKFGEVFLEQGGEIAASRLPMLGHPADILSARLSVPMSDPIKDGVNRFFHLQIAGLRAYLALVTETSRVQDPDASHETLVIGERIRRLKIAPRD